MYSFTGGAKKELLCLLRPFLKSYRKQKLDRGCGKNMSKQVKADIFLLAMAGIWGASFTLMKNVLDHMPTFAYLSMRFIIASVLLIIIFRKRLGKADFKTIAAGCVVGLALFGGMALQVSGLHYTTASNSAFITGLNIVIVPIVSSVLLKKKPDKASVAGVMLAFAGIFFISGGPDSSFNIGDFLTFLCAICFTFQVILIDKFTNKYDSIILAVAQISFAAVLNTVVWVAFDFRTYTLDSSVVFTLIVTGVLGTALAFAGQTIVQKFTTPTRTALILAAEPLFGTLFAIMIPNSQGMREALRFNSVVGFLLILAGMLVSELKPGKREDFKEDAYNMK